MNENERIKNEEEISLLDLFTVLLRYRKLIIGITLAFVVLAIVGFFTYPNYKYKKAQRTNISQGIFRIEIEPKAQPYISLGLEGFILRPEILTDSLYESGKEEFAFKGGKIKISIENKLTVMYLINLFWLQNLDLNGNIFIERGKEHKYLFRVRRTGSVIEITFKDKDPEIILKFLESIFSLVTVDVEEDLQPRAQLMVRNYERISNLPKISDSMQMMLENTLETYLFLKDFLDGKEVVVKRKTEPVITENFFSLLAYRKQYIKIGIVIVFAGFILGVLFAFALNALHNIKNDEEAMKKINEALGNSGEK